MPVTRFIVMRTCRLALAAAGVAAVLAGLPAAAHTQSTGDVAVIVNKDLAVDNLALADLRRIVLGDREFWPSGARVTLLIHAPVARERDAAVKTVCDMTEAQFRQHWIGKVFRAETATGPKIIYSNESAVETVSKSPGAIAFVDAGAATKAVKVLKIDGLLPGQTGYKLK